MALDGRGLARTCAGRGEAPEIHTQLCRAQLAAFQEAVASGEPLLVGCTQEAPRFEEARAEFGPATEVAYVNIRERAGWSEQGPAALPKIAALLAEAALEIPPAASVTLKSDGDCLVYGRDEQALEAAKQLASRLSVTVILTGAAEVIPPRRMDVPVYRGTVSRRAAISAPSSSRSRALPRSWSPRGRRWLSSAPRDGVATRVRSDPRPVGGAPLFPAHAKRDGYLAGPRRSRGGPARAVRRDRPGRRVREAALRPVRGRALRPLALAPHRVHALPRGLPGGRDPPAGDGSRSTLISAAAAAPATASARPVPRPTPIRRRPRSSSGSARFSRATGGGGTTPRLARPR